MSPAAPLLLRLGALLALAGRTAASSGRPAFVPPSSPAVPRVPAAVPTRALSARRRPRGDYGDDGDDGYGDDDEDYEYARVGRRRGRGAEREDDPYDDSVYDDDGDRRRRYRDEPRMYDDDEDFDEDDEAEEYEEGILIPNPILDSIDPEGAADRLDELFGDPKWWRDTAAVLAVTLAAYLYTYDPATLIPWDRVTPDSFDLQALYEARGFGP